MNVKRVFEWDVRIVARDRHRRGWWLALGFQLEIFDYNGSFAPTVYMKLGGLLVEAGRLAHLQTAHWRSLRRGFRIPRPIQVVR